MMQAMVIEGAGKLAKLVLQQRATPRPGPGQVLVRVAAAGLNRPDLYQLKGKYPPPTWAPADIPGLEVAGIVEELGDGVEAIMHGKKVCTLLSGGGYATHVLAEAAHCLPIPTGWSYEEAASLPETIFTVWDNVFQRGRLKVGETLLVHGGSSGIGITAIQLAKAKGARVFATAGSDPKCRACEKLGAERCINYKEEDFAQGLANKEIDVILDMVGGDYVQKNLALLNEEGRLVFINTMKGSKVEVDFGMVMRRRLHITGSTLRNRSNDFKAELTKAVREQVWPLLENGQFNAVISSVSPFEEADMRLRQLEDSQHIGKMVLVMPGF